MSGHSNDPKPAKGDQQPDGDKDRMAKTKPMPPNTDPEFKKWAEKQPKAKEGDKGKSPPDPPKDQKEPREHGSPHPKTEEDR
ncbi:MAG TPA: hypothetical protein VGR37_15650 [Longimicrobiaceae bacterium]|nr:hypothetical protein [Longimicrobiaceae bacterium]